VVLTRRWPFPFCSSSAQLAWRQFSRRRDWAWRSCHRPARSPDLPPPKFLFVGMHEGKGSSQAYGIATIKFIALRWLSHTQVVYMRGSIRRRCEARVQPEGGHFEHVLTVYSTVSTQTCPHHTNKKVLHIIVWSRLPDVPFYPTCRVGSFHFINSQLRLYRNETPLPAPIPKLQHFMYSAALLFRHWRDLAAKKRKEALKQAPITNFLRNAHSVTNLQYVKYYFFFFVRFFIWRIFFAS
jgi:hypothetical protein